MINPLVQAQNVCGTITVHFSPDVHIANLHDVILLVHLVKLVPVSMINFTYDIIKVWFITEKPYGAKF